IRSLTDRSTLALHLAVGERRADALDLRAEQLLDRALDVDLVRVHRDLEHQRPVLLADHRRLLGDERAPNDVRQFHHPSASCSFSSAARVRTTRRVSTTSRALIRLLASSCTPSMLRTDSARRSSGFTS